jgi:hypothetical protein
LISLAANWGELTRNFLLLNNLGTVKKEMKENEKDLSIGEAESR